MRGIVPYDKLSVLYIEENTEDQLMLRRVLKTRINTDIRFDTAATAEIGLKKVKGRNYDLVFLGFRLPDKTGVEFLEEIRGMGKTVPVIFLRGKGNEAQSRTEVHDYTIESEIHTNEFIDSVRRQLKGKTGASSLAAELSVLEKEALQEIESNDVSEIRLETGKGSLHYTGMRRFSETRGMEVTSLILRTLAEKGIIKEIDDRRVVVCPVCETAVTAADRSNYICPSCKGKKFVRVKFLSHPFCGFTGDRRAFVAETGLVCPNCKVELTMELDSPISMDSDGYFVLGNSFECETCDTKFNKPEMVHSCDRCGDDFSYKTMDYIHLRDYRLA